MSATKKPQLERFKEAARESGADMSKEEFARVISKITRRRSLKQRTRNQPQIKRGDDAA